MLSRLIARSMMVVIPQKLPAVITLNPDTSSPVTVRVNSAWLKPISVSRSLYGDLNLQGNETLIKIPQHELNPDGNGYEIRVRDQISIDGATYRVLMATLKSVRTVWECVARKEMT